ncbi:hypothetical protein [Acidithiobacillus sulfuriphilus]|uniref:hypothetical protein n=1 Tax=Acidithiobacillus sulfuriphilus TaxID=1867749 RepID=UPI003F60D0C7
MPSITDRMRKRFIVVSSDRDLNGAIAAAVPAGWEMVAVTDLEDLGAWQEILLHRFLLLNLDDAVVEDPVGLVDTIRREYQLNIAIFCIGGDQEQRDAVRMARADRFFGREETLTRLPEFFAQFGW